MWRRLRQKGTSKYLCWKCQRISSQPHAPMVAEKWCGRIERSQHQVQSVLHLQGGHHKHATRENRGHKTREKNPNRPKETGERRKMNALQNIYTPSTSDKKPRVTVNSLTQVVDYIASSPTSNGEKLVSTFITGGSCCRVRFSYIHVTFEYRHKNRRNQLEKYL